jgi:signal transduction histidine kinase
MKGPSLSGYAGQVKIFLVLLVLFLAVAIYFNFHLLVIARDAIQEEAGRRLGLEADLVRTELERDQLIRGLSAKAEAVPYIPPTYLERMARLKGMSSIEIVALDGRIISSSVAARVNGQDRLIAQPAGRERGKLMSGGTAIAKEKRVRGTRGATLTAYRPIQDRSRRAVAFIRVEQEVPLLTSVDFDLRTIAALQAGGLVFVLVLVIFFTRWLLAPYRRMQRAAGEAPGGLSKLGLDGGAQDDADQLVEAFRGVIGKLREQEDELQTLKGVQRDARQAGLVPGDHLIAGMSSAVLIFDHRGSLVELNAAAELLLGTARPAAVGRSCAALLSGNERLAGLIAEALRSGQGRSREVVPLLGADGRTTHLGVMLSPIGRPHDGTGVAGASIEGVLCLLTDLTEIKMLRERVGMKENLAALGEMSAGIAHEFRNALAAIQGYARLLAKGDAVLAGERREHADAILREVGGIRAVIDDFLRFARPGSLDLAEVDLRCLVEDLVRDFRADPLAGGIDLAVEGEFPALVADEMRLRQALLNLLRNAAEAVQAVATPAVVGGSGHEPVARGRITVRGALCPPPREGVRIFIEDDGIGIPLEDQPRIFTPFFTTRDGGTGLGLALVQKTVIMHDGRIEVDSVPGQGTRVAVVLPQRPGGDGAYNALA